VIREHRRRAAVEPERRIACHAGGRRVAVRRA
jgi:hypothetical protein